MESCDERERLTALYKEAMDLYAVCANDVLAVRHRTSKEEYNRLMMASSESLAAARSTLLAVKRHINQHGCGLSDN
jgi:uncharacterized protein